MKHLKISFKTEWPLLTVILLATLSSFYFYLNFPEIVPTHWGLDGQPNGWSSKAFAAFFFPVLVWGMYLLFILLPKIDPRGVKYQQFGRSYRVVRNAIIYFLIGVYLLVGLNGIGYQLPVGTYVPVGVGLLFVIIGGSLTKLKSNWFIGIRTPWTLSSEETWSKTHRFGSKIFVLSGLLFMASPWLAEKWQVGLFISIIALMSIGTFGYSYYIYRQEGEKKK